MRYEEAIAKHEPLSERENGLVAGLHAYSWMKDGQTFVGTGSRLLGDAIDRMITESRARESSHPSVAGELIVPPDESVVAVAVENAVEIIEESVADILSINGGGKAKRPSYRGSEYDAAYAQGRKDACRVLLIDLGAADRDVSSSDVRTRRDG